MQGTDRGEPLPGPIRWPIFGSLFYLVKYKERVLMDWAEIYGPVFGFKLGSVDAVAVNGYEAVKELLSNNIFSSRQEKYIFQSYRKPGQGIFFCPDNQIHRKLKPFLIRNIHLLNEEIESNIRVETTKMIKYFHQRSGEALDLRKGVGMTIANIILKLLYSTSYEYDSSELETLMRLACIGKSDRDKKVAAMASLNWLQHIPGANSPAYCPLHKEATSSMANSNILSMNTASPNEEDREQLYCLSEDSMTGGTQTTNCQFLWILLELLQHPQYIPQIEKEIQQVFGSKPDDDDNRKYFDRELHGELHLTRAVIEEGLRLRPIAPTSVFHVATRATNFRGFHMPLGVAVMPNIWSVHRDPDFWSPDPDRFRPERHLDDCGRFAASGRVIAFSGGRRKCGGYAIVDRMLVAFLVAVVAHFRLELVEPEAVADDGESILIYHPPPFRVRITPRDDVTET